MATVKFRIQNHKIDDNGKYTEPSLIVLIYRYNGNKFVYSTGEKIMPDLWNKIECRAYSRKGRSDLSSLNALLDRYEVHIKTAARELKEEGHVLTNSILKERMDILTGKIEARNNDTLISFGEHIVEKYKQAGKVHKSMTTTVNILDRYKKGISFNEINTVFYDMFVSWMMNEGYSKNYIGKTIGNIKIIMNEAVDTGITKNQKYKSTKFKRIKEKVHNIYLTVEELEKLHKHKFKKDYLDNACDLFLIGAFTGMRFSDFNRLSLVNFQSGEFVIQDTQKVSGRVIIPQHRIVKDILNKRNRELPRPISNAKLNKYLKDIGKEAKIDSDIIKTRTQGFEKESKVYKKWELMTTHTARRSLATNLYLAGIPIKTIMMLTGHKSVAQLMDYIKITEQEMAESLKDHPFFN
jgi:integrase